MLMQAFYNHTFRSGVLCFITNYIAHASSLPFHSIVSFAMIGSMEAALLEYSLSNKMAGLMP